MAKQKSPFFGLGASGTVAGTITAVRRRGLDVVESTPFPFNPQSLPQSYHRWLYRDYCNWWRTLSLSDRESYRSAATTLGLTIFAYWMRLCLRTLPDLAGYWRFDNWDNLTFEDFSLENNPMTLLGCVQDDGVISNAAYFDGINDRSVVLNLPALTDFTIMFFAKRTGSTGTRGGILGIDGEKVYTGPGGLQILDWNNGLIRVIICNGGFPVQELGYLDNAFTDNVWRHYAVRWTKPDVTYFRNGFEFDAGIWNDDIDFSTYDLILGLYITHFFNGSIDQVIIKNRALTDAEIYAHSQRRYPLK